MSTANLLRHLSFINNFGIFHPQSQWLSRNAVRCFSHNTNTNTNTNTADASGLPVRYIPKRRQFVDNKQSAATDISLIPSTSVFPPNSFQVDSTQGNMQLKSEGPILNHCDGHEKDLTDEQHIKVHKQAVDCMKTGQLAAHDALTYKIGALREGTKLNQELGSGGLVDEECMEASEELSEDDAQSNNTYFKAKPDKTRQGAKSSGLREGIKLNQELGSDGLVDEECMEASEEVFEDEDVQSNNTYFKPNPDKTRQGAEKLAVQLLARRAFTALELRKKLGAKLFPLNIVETVVRDFQNRGLINDGLYAETFSHSRWKSSSWGPRRIKQALSTKGVNEDDVEKAVKLVFEDCEEGEERSSVRLSSSSLNQLYIQASKQWQRSHDVAHETRKARVIRWLHYRGFDWGVIGSIIKKLESDKPGAILP